MPTPTGITVQSLLDTAVDALDGVLAQPVWQTTPDEQLSLVESCQQVLARVEAAQAQLLASIDAGEVTMSSMQLTTPEWLQRTNRMSSATARSVVDGARKLARFDSVRVALSRGEISWLQAKAMVDGLAALPAELTSAEVAEAERLLLERVDEFDPAYLRRLANGIVNIVAPEAADEADQRALERLEREARKNRYLWWRNDGHGSVNFHGKVPTADGEAIITAVEALAAQPQRGLDSLTDDAADWIPWSHRRADALVRLAHLASGTGQLPAHGGDRPQVIVTIDADALRTGLGHANLLATGESISPQAARLLACDCDLIPAVLGEGSAILDIARSKRLVSGRLRTALWVRDQGCVFPGCDRRPRDCEAHHIIPWWYGGPTSLGNCALLCPHHHRLVEPDRRNPIGAPPNRWVLRIADDGVPEFLPPAGLDPRRRALRHQRFRIPTSA